MNRDALINEVLDHHEIRKVLALFCHGCDRLDAEKMVSVCAQESFDDHGPFKLPGDQFVHTTIPIMREMNDMISHQMGQSQIEVRGDKAGAETYFIASLRRVEEAGDRYLDQMGGRYVDELQRTEAGWKITKRIAVLDWSITHKIIEAHMDHAGFVAGERSQADVAYAALGWTHSGQKST